MWNHHRTHRKEDYKHTQTHTGQEREENKSSALLLFVRKRYETTLKAADYADDALFFLKHLNPFAVAQVATALIGDFVADFFGPDGVLELLHHGFLKMNNSKTGYTS